jgi:hypothetical protein
MAEYAEISMHEKAMEQKKNYAERANQTQAQMGLASDPYLEPARPNIMERVANDLRRAQRESRKADRLGELEYLLNKHPDIARILDLIEDVR